MPFSLPPLEQRTLTAVAHQRLAHDPDSTLVRDPARSLSCAQLYEEALAVAGGFAAPEVGVGVGDHVLLMLDNHVDYVVAWWALGLTGRVEVPVNTAYKKSILAHVINTSGARVMVIDRGYVPWLAEIAGTIPQLERVVVRDPDEASRELLRDRFRVMSWEELRGPRIEAMETRPWDLMGILYTSGTTGPSKGVRVTHAHAYGYSALLDHIVGPEDVALCDLPLFHIGGQWAMLYKAFIVGASAVILPRFSAGSYWENVRKYGCTTTMMLGAVANFLYNQPPLPDDAKHPLRRAFIVPVIAQLAELQQRFGITEVASGFGMTEASTIMLAPRGTVVPGRCGWPREDFEVRLVDEDDLEVPDGQVGELIVRAREPWSLMDGYHGMPEATVKCWRNQWLHTGDAMKREKDDGQYVFVDRMKDAVRRRGENVSSFEVEKEINAHPAVLESAVVAVASAATEDEIRACVVLREGSVVEAAALLAFLDERLPRFMVPRYLDFLDALPKTPTEKVQKQKLRDQGLSATTYDRERSKRNP